MRSLMLAVIALLLAARIEAATVLVTSKPSGAIVQIGAEERGDTPLRLSLAAGNYTLTVVKEGYEPTVQALSVKNKLMRVNITLEKKKHPVDVVFEDPAEAGWYVFVDGKLAMSYSEAAMAPTTLRLCAGKVRLVLVKSGFRDIKMTVDIVEDGQLIELKAPVRGTSSVSKVPWLRYVGCWIKEDSGSKLFINGDMTFRVATFDGHTWTDKIRVIPRGVQIKTREYKPLSLRFCEDGKLRGVKPNGHAWVLRRQLTDK